MPALDCEVVKICTVDGRFSVETSLTDIEAANKCLERTDYTPRDAEFARSLANKVKQDGVRSINQKVWLHIMALKEYTPAQTVHVGDFQGLIKLFQTALHYDQTQGRQGRKARSPKITLETPSGYVVALKTASELSRNAGMIYVTSGEGTYLGKIDRSGDLHKTSQDLPQEAMDLLAEFSRSPQEVAEQYGAKTGKCCFCARHLQDEKGDAGSQRGSSVEQGYGLVCARRYGLYHTNLTGAEKIAVANRQ